MDPQRRRQYLEALGIEVWVPRPVLPATPPPAAAAVVEVAAPVEARPARPAPRAPAGTAPGWDALKAAVATCRSCRLCETRTQTVFGVGPAAADLMVVGEAPGADEDAKGEPFVGRAGKLLDEMLKAIGRSRSSDTWIVNVVKCRPPDNREPAEDEAEACRHFLEQQIRHIRPRLLVALGGVAAKRLLMTEDPVGRMRGRTFRWGPEETPLMVTYHPAYLLRNPGEKAKSWQDLKAIHRFLKAP